VPGFPGAPRERYDPAVQDPQVHRAPSVPDVLLFLLGIAGVAAAITIIFLADRAVMDVGGNCADGGPYVSAQPCPGGVALAMLVGFLGGLAALGLAAWKGAAIGGGASSVVLLAWPALFGVLGLSMLQSGFDPPGDDPGWAWGYVITGVVFVAMAFIPLLAWWSFNWLTGPAAGPAAGTAARALATEPPPVEEAGGPGGDGEAARPDDALVDGLERLAALHGTDALTDEEYARAKADLLEGADA
jgi:hypothetical protein